MNASPATSPATELSQLLAAARLPDIPPPETLEALYGLGYRCLEAAEYDKARAVFEVLQRMQPDRCDFVAGVGHAAFGQGDAEVALQQFILATELEPNNAGLMIGLGPWAWPATPSWHWKWPRPWPARPIRPMPIWPGPAWP